MLELKPTEHSYYCSESNYYVGNQHGENFGRSDYDTWEAFKEDWLEKDLSIDDDYNHCFRFDIQEHCNEDDEPTGKFELLLFFVLQRKGIYRPVVIQNITEQNMVEINEFLSERFKYLMGQWSEFSNK